MCISNCNSKKGCLKHRIKCAYKIVEVGLVLLHDTQKINHEYFVIQGQTKRQVF